MAENSVPLAPTLLIGRREAARLCGVSPASWDRLTAAGKVPPSLRLGGRVLWNRDSLRLWVSLGLPSRADFIVLIETNKMSDQSPVAAVRKSR